MVVILHQTSKMKTCVPFFLPFLGLFLAVFLIFRAFPQTFDPKCLTWLESSGNKLSIHTFPKFLGGTSKCPEFCTAMGINCALDVYFSPTFFTNILPLPGIIWCQARLYNPFKKKGKEKRNPVICHLNKGQKMTNLNQTK